MNEERFAAALVTAMRSAGLGSVYIDGREVARAVNRRSQLSGKPAIT